MLGVSSYSPAYIAERRAQLRAHVGAFRDLAGAASVDGAVGAFEPLFFNDLVVVLDASFVHRLRGKEGKDGNPLNEVRMLADSILRNGGALAGDKTIKYTPETSVLGLELGAAIALDEEQFERLADAFFAELERKFI
jgi:hypothetical protein